MSPAGRCRRTKFFRGTTRCRARWSTDRKRWRIDSGMIGVRSHELRRAARAAIECWLAGLLEPLPSEWQRRLVGRFGHVLLEQRSGEWFAGWVAGLSLREAATTVSLSGDDSFDAAR